MTSNKRKIALYIGTIVTTILLCTVGMMALQNYMTYEEHTPHDNMETRENRDQSKFDFLMRSGDTKFKDGRYQEALKQYELALDIIPNDSIANAKILECSRHVFQ